MKGDIHMSYKNILADKFMKDTNYIIIKDTDDLEDLEKQWELFKSCLTNRQQRLSDDRSIELWDMTNQQHYEAQKAELMKSLSSKLDDSNDEEQTIVYEPDEEDIKDDEITKFVDMEFDDFQIPDDENDISEPVKEDAEIPIVKKTPASDIDIGPRSIYDQIKNPEKDAIADQYEIDSNINIIGSIRGYAVPDMLDSLEKSYIKWNSQNQDHRKKSDDKCREIYGMSNIDRYNKIKGLLNAKLSEKTAKDVKPNISDNVQSSESLNAVIESCDFVKSVYENMLAVNEAKEEHKRTRPFNDTPYFTPMEMIDMGVHDNDNWYSSEPDNDCLISNISVTTWFDSYKDMCMDHIFEDYTVDWIKTLDKLYSDFEEIKESGDEAKILARKQSILDLGWNPEVPFTRHNRKLATKRVMEKLDKCSPMNLFINLDKEVPDDDVMTEPVIEENAKKNTHQPIYLVFIQGSIPVISPIIQKVTDSPYSHAAISFDASLKNMHSYTMSKLGVIKESIEDYGDDIVTVMAFYAPTKIFNNIKDSVMDFYINSGKTVYDVGILFKKLFHKNERVVEDKYHQVCSTFVDYVLRAGDVTLDAIAKVPSPAELYNGAKTKSNKIIEVYTGPANKYDAEKTEKKMNKLLKKGIKAIDEAAKLPSGITMRNATKADTDYMYKCEMDSIDPKLKTDKKVIKYIEKDVQDSIPNTKILMSDGKVIGMFTTDSLDSTWYYIGELYIEPEYRSKGIGSALIKDYIDHHDHVKLQVAPSNTRAISLYKSFGFEKESENEHMIVMRYEKKKLDEAVVNEVKQFPVEFDKEGNLIIHKARVGLLSFGDEIDDSVKLLQVYRNSNNIEGMKYELAKLWFINDAIEKKLNRKLPDKQYRELINTRAVCLNVFKSNLEYVLKADKNFNFAEYYNTTPFSDNSVKITNDTIKYSMRAITGMV